MMPDMLVKLYALPKEEESLEQYEQRTGITIRRALAPEKGIVTQWVRERFGGHWMSETEIAFARSPISCLIAVRENSLLGFACYDTTMKGFFGPTGVDTAERTQGIGKMLLLGALRRMYDEGYGYAVIGGAGPTQFYARTAGAVEIPDSVPGIYKGLLKEHKNSL